LYIKKYGYGLGVMSQPVILDVWEVEIWRIVVPGHPRQNIHKTPSQPIKAGCGGILLSY
jgi:hypothetical protein